MTPTGPLDHLDRWLPEHVRAVVRRETAIPTIAIEAARRAAENPALVRADIGQISGLDPDREVLYGPPVGLHDLRAVVAETWNRAFELGDGALTAANVTITTGAAEALALLFHCFAGDRVVGLPRGHWENYSNAVTMARGQVAAYDAFDADGRLDLDGLARTISGEGIRVLLVNFPSNPTGAALDAGELRALADLARAEDLVVLSDEVYARLRYDGVAPQTFLRHAPERTVILSSASKEYLIPGARTGFVLSARSAVTDRVLRKLVRANTASPNVLGQRCLLEMMESDLEDLRAGREPVILTRVRSEMKARRDRLVAVLAHHGLPPIGRPGHIPQGSIFLMVGMPAWWREDAEAFARAALEGGWFSVVPGASFGLPGTVRFSYGGLTAEAIARLDANLTAFRASLEG